MNNLPQENVPSGDDRDEALAGRKKTYATPELTQFGTIKDLTTALQFGPDDGTLGGTSDTKRA
jgi:hypothetical protein